MKTSSRGPEQLRQDALAIWRAGVDAVRSDALVKANVRRDSHWLNVGDEVVDLDEVRRIVVVGAGKAGAGMAAGLEEVLGDELMAEKELTGWINVPANCVRPLRHIHLHAARPANLNEPTQGGVEGTERMLEMIGGLGGTDLCLCLMSGGGSALMPAPVEGITLQDKQLVTKYLSDSGANIQQLNTVRKQLSRVKGGRLAQACVGAPLLTLIISDVLGDPLDIIGSGPTVADSGNPQLALRILEKFGAESWGIPQVLGALSRAAQQTVPSFDFRHVHNMVIGNNAVAVDAAGVEAERRGYSHAMSSATTLEGLADDVGQHLAKMALRMLEESGPDCLISGGEPVVKLADPRLRGRGGRNQQLALSALIELGQSRSPESPGARSPGAHSTSARAPLSGLILLSGGTDGEDGPTDAAGAFVDEEVFRLSQQLQLDSTEFLMRNDAYNFFERAGGLIRTGPTDTNVYDVRVVLVERIEPQSRSFP